ncbi:1751_t:CDS:2, partial [Paraglomus occultum]
MDNVTVDLEAVIAGNRSSLLMPSDSDLSVNYTKLEEQDTLEGLSQRRLSDQSRRLSDEVDKFFDESPPNLRGKNRVNRMRESLALFKRLND